MGGMFLSWLASFGISRFAALKIVKRSRQELWNAIYVSKCLELTNEEVSDSLDLTLASDWTYTKLFTRLWMISRWFLQRNKNISDRGHNKCNLYNPSEPNNLVKLVLLSC